MLAPGELDAPRGRRQQAGERLEQGRLARAVAPEQRDDLALAHVERGVVQDVALAVERVDALEARAAAARARPRRPGRAAGDGRRAAAGVDLLHARSARTSSGVPAISTSPWFITVTRCEKPSTRSMSCSTISTGISLAIVSISFDDALALGRRQARQRLVEQQHLRPRAPARCRGRAAAVRHRTGRRPRCPRCLRDRETRPARRIWAWISA